MNVTTSARLVRKVLTGVAVATVAATCLVSSGASASPSTHRSDASSATKEWKARSSSDVLSATKVWKTYTSTSSTASKTKEW